MNVRNGTYVSVIENTFYSASAESTSLDPMPARYYIMVNPYYEVSERVVLTVWDAFGEVGGLSGFIFGLMQMVSNSFQSFFYLQALTSKVFADVFNDGSAGSSKQSFSISLVDYFCFCFNKQKKK